LFTDGIMKRQKNPFNAVSDGYRNDLNKMVSGMPKLSSPLSSRKQNGYGYQNQNRYQKDNDFDYVEVYEETYIEEKPRYSYHRSQPYEPYHLHIPKETEQLLTKVVILVVGTYLAWLFVIQPIVTWIQLSFIPVIVTAWQNLILFIASTQTYLLIGIFLGSSIFFTKFFEKKGVIYPWSIRGGILAALSVVLMIIGAT